MNNPIASSVLHTFIITFLQFVFLKNIDLIFFNSYSLSIIVYPLIIIILPLKTPKSLILVFAFCLGILADLFYNSPGVHAGALVFMAFSRNFILKIIEPRGGYRIEKSPNMYNYGLSWFMYYAGSLLFLEIFVYFLFDTFAIEYLDKIVLNTLISFLVSYVLILLYQVIVRNF